MASKKFRYVPLILLLIGFAALLWWLTRGHTVAVLQPRGEIAARQKSILTFAFLLSMVVIVPVYALTIFIIWKYRAGNKKNTKYTPEWDHNRRMELAWWGIPCAIILILSVVTWRTSHSLDPFKPVYTDRTPMTIQVVALQWKWLFIYPDKHIATVNYVRIPVDTPVDFKVTADAPMNSFWIPQLGGQIYAMPGMSTEVHLIADKEGSYRGSSANISGTGFASMNFEAEAVSPDAFDAWVKQTGQDKRALDNQAYSSLADPHTNIGRDQYGKVTEGLYDSIVMRYMVPDEQSTAQTNTPISGEPAHAW